MTIVIDFETKSFSDLRKTGAWAYSENPTTDVICVCYGIDSQPRRSWCPGLGDNTVIPHELKEALKEGHHVEAWNVAFEYSIWRNVLERKYNWPAPADDQWLDTQAVARYYALPPALDRCAGVLGFQGKDAEGSRLISRYSKLHLKSAKSEIPEEDLRKFVAYCDRDVAIEQSVSDYLGDLPARELPVYMLDQIVNRRGLYLDLPGIEAAADIVDIRSEELTERFLMLTGGIKPTQVAQLMAWFKAHGLGLPDMRAETIEELIEEGEIAAGPAREALSLRLQVSKASTKKLDKMAMQRGRDGRARFQTIYHGAATGRNTGTGLQPLNLNRGFEKVDPDRLVRDIMYRDPQWLDAVYGDATDAVAKAVRHFIMAEPGNVIYSGDFVSIEAVILACLAGEDWKVDMFRRKEPVYERTADKVYGLPTGTVTKETHPKERQTGKTCELAFGYQGALGAWLKFDSSGAHTDEQIIGYCRSWRREHQMIVQFWYGLERIAIEAVRHPGKVLYYNMIGFEIQDEWLTMILPNEKRIWYWKPELRVKMPKWHEPKVKDDCAEGTCRCRPQPVLTYMAQKFGQWRRTETYGGKLAENATQATSRELLIPAALRAEAAGYHVILTVYDEVVSEVPKGFGSKQEFAELMTVCPGDWAAGWPISVDVSDPMNRYKK